MAELFKWIGHDHERLIGKALAYELFNEARANEATKLDGDLEQGFTYQSAIGECRVLPVAAQDVPGEISAESRSAQ